MKRDSIFLSSEDTETSIKRTLKGGPKVLD